MVYLPGQNTARSLYAAAPPERLNSYSFEQGPIRPPSEAYSLLIRATRSCPWNRCEFCDVYRSTRFELRDIQEVKKDVEMAKAISDEVVAVAWKLGYGGQVKEVAAMIYSKPLYSSCVRSVALWLHFGGETVFLQDSNSLIMRTPELVELLRFLKESFPNINRVTSYGRSHTASKKTIAELKELYDAGLSRLHIGLETGYDPLLSYMQKGITAKHHIEGGRRIKESGISLCEYVMPGLGGRRMWKEHVTETARVLNVIDPDYIRIRSLIVLQSTGLGAKLAGGDFEPRTEDEVIEEIRMLIERLECTSHIVSDQMANLLGEIEGKLLQDKEKILKVIDEYLDLSLEERLKRRLTIRASAYIGIYGGLGELEESVSAALESIEAQSPDAAEKAESAISALKERFR